MQKRTGAHAETGQARASSLQSKIPPGSSADPRGDSKDSSSTSPPAGAMSGPRTTDDQHSVGNRSKTHFGDRGDLINDIGRISLEVEG